MTLKKCTVVELDPTFWRVDFDGELELAGAASTYSKWSGPFCIQVVPVRERLFTAFASGIGTSICGPTQRDAVDALLTHLGLARHDKPETAEDRVRAIATGHFVGDESVRDLRAILAELDRVRAQPPVDVEAVLAPFRKEHARLYVAMIDHASQAVKYQRDSPTGFDLARAATEEAGRAAYCDAMTGLIDAIAEAEKIGRGE